MLVRHRVTKLKDTNFLSVAHLDPAVVNDAYAVAIGHAEKKDIEGSSGGTIVVIDALIAWQPSAYTNVSITNVQDVLLTINGKRPLRKITADHHNSWETLERFRFYGIKSESLYFSQKLQLEMYENLRLLMHEGRLILPNDSPYRNLLLDELVRIQLIKGKKIDHPRDCTKDLADSVAGVAWQLTGKSINYNMTPSVFNTKRTLKTAGLTYFSEFGKTRYTGGFRDDEVAPLESYDRF
jgi:hypothetical protein